MRKKEWGKNPLFDLNGGNMGIESEIVNLIKDVITENNYVLEKVEFVKESGNYFLRVIISNNKEIEIDDCVFVSTLINPIIDDINFIKESFILDVCSKGVEESE